MLFKTPTGSHLPNLCFVYRNFAEAVDRRSSSKYERLESELQGYKTNLIKESIRLGYNDLGDFHYEKGDLAVREWVGLLLA